MINSLTIINTEEYHLVCFIIISNKVSNDSRLRMHPQGDLGPWKHFGEESEGNKMRS